MGKKNNSLISESEAKEIKELFQDILETKDLHKVTVQELREAMKGDSLLERFAARKANNL